MAAIRDRIKEFRRVPAEDLVPDDDNLRLHPEVQRQSMRAILQEIGYAGAALAWEDPALPEGKFRLIDGHLRQEESAGQLVPTLILDVTRDEAKMLMALFDPLGDLATIDRDRTDEVLRAVTVGSDELAVMLLELSGQGSGKGARGRAEKELKPEPEMGPPEMLLRPYEHYDYVLVLARTSLDWNVLCDKLGLERVDASAVKGLGKIGLGRCIDAKRILERLDAAT
jgi:hypothetical protein